MLLIYYEVLLLYDSYLVPGILQVLLLSVVVEQ